MTESLDSMLSPLAQAVLDAVAEGIVVLDTAGRLAYANGAGRAAVERLGVVDDGARSILPKLSRLGSRMAPVWIGGRKVCEVVCVPAQSGGDHRTLAERERHAIVETLEATGWKLTDSAHMLGISRTTLWRRLRAYGLDRDGRSRWSPSS